MNSNQKKVTLGFITSIFMSVIFVPQEIVTGDLTDFLGFVFIADLNFTIALKVIFVEWVGIASISYALYKYFE